MDNFFVYEKMLDVYFHQVFRPDNLAFKFFFYWGDDVELIAQRITMGEDHSLYLGLGCDAPNFSGSEVTFAFVAVRESALHN